MKGLSKKLSEEPNGKPTLFKVSETIEKVRLQFVCVVSACLCAFIDEILA